MPIYVGKKNSLYWRKRQNTFKLHATYHPKRYSASIYQFLRWGRGEDK